MQVPEVKCRSLKAIMQVLGGDNAGPGRDILWPELMRKENETLLEKTEWTRSLRSLRKVKNFQKAQQG